ncbi:MAG: hypothetical protein H6651_02045 [Ardenticatenales bacterium]|nr:hypothetical protein [Ardenticatenales bacterium]
MSASGCTVETIRDQGQLALKLSNGLVSTTFLPAIGGKLSAIYHIPTGREWLARNPYLPHKPVVYDGDFVGEFDSAGLDECFPAISAGPFPVAPWQGTLIPDHGEVWCQPWEWSLSGTTEAQIVLEGVCYGARFPYRFARTITLDRGQSALQLTYEVTNLSQFAFPFVWSIHPILNVSAGMEIVLPAGVDKLRLDGATSDYLGPAGSHHTWPIATDRAGRPLDLATIPTPDFQRASKFYTAPLSGDEPVVAGVREPAGPALMFRFLPQEISHIGLWMNWGGWSGCGSPPYFNLGLEPCIGGTDSLARAREMNEFATLPARQSRRWHLAIELS